MSGPAVTDSAVRDSSDKPRAQRVRIQLSFNRGTGSDLEEALRIAGLSPSDSGVMAQVFVLGALAWSQGGGVNRTRDGLHATFPAGVPAPEGLVEPRPVVAPTPPLAAKGRDAQEKTPARAEPSKARTSVSPVVPAPAKPAPSTSLPPASEPRAVTAPAASTVAEAIAASGMRDAGPATDGDAAAADQQDADFDPMNVNIAELSLPPLT